MKLRILLFLVISLNISCNPTDRLDKSIDSTLKKDFNSNEIQELKLIINFFDNLVIDQANQTNLDSAYNKFMEKLRNNYSNEELLDKLFVNKNSVDSFLDNFKTKKIYDKIWKLEYGFDYISKDTLITELIPNQQGKYIDLLDKVIEIDTLFNDYKNSLLTTGGIPPSIVGGFQNIHEELDFENELIRLFVAIHYISIMSYTRLDEK